MKSFLKFLKIVSFIFAGFCFLSILFAIFADDPKPRQPEFTQMQIDSIAHAKFINVQFSPWDGTHKKSVEAIKELMNDPESFESVNTTYKESDNKLIVFTKFRGKNAFGGVITQTYVTRTDSVGNIEFIREYEPRI